jgi:Arc/MetJ family transcription regulator
MAVRRISIPIDTDIADKAAKIRGVKLRTETVEVALREIVALKRFKKLMKKHAGKLSFDGCTE